MHGCNHMISESIRMQVRRLTRNRLHNAISRRLHRLGRECIDVFNVAAIRVFDRWPCHGEKYLVVGCESSGTTAIANLLFLGNPSIRFLEEGEHPWVWNAYMSIYQKTSSITDYPRLQLFDAIKVPGFAVIIAEFRHAFPNTRVIYCVRDPRDVVNSAINTWKVKIISELEDISWSKETWLGIERQDPVERLALRWKRYLQSATVAGNVLFVRYEDFCSNKVETIRELSSQLGLPFNQDRVRRLCDVQLSPKSVRDYRPIKPGGWHSGMLQRDHVRSIEEICKPEMEKWNYPLAFHS
jgi:hypothetical protein